MTKDELIEAMKDFPGDMEVKVNGYNRHSDEWDNFDIKSINKCYEYNKDILLIKLD